MTITRRKFLKTSGNLSATFAMATLAAASPFASCFNEKNRKKAFGLQLYTLRNEMPNDPRGVLQSVASYGYTQIESYEGPMGMFWGMEPVAFSSFCKDLGMQLVASHCNIGEDFEIKAAQAAAAGLKYLVCPWIGPQPDLDSYKKFAATFNEKGRICQKNGIRFAYHNHDYSFKTLEEKIPQDILMEYTDKELVDFEMDIYWVVTAGADPVHWLEKYRNRFRLCHIKDRSATPVDNNSLNSTDLGKGIIDFKAILKIAGNNGMKYHIVEQEAYPYGSALEAARYNAAYMQQLRL